MQSRKSRNTARILDVCWNESLEAYQIKSIVRQRHNVFNVTAALTTFIERNSKNYTEI